LKKNNGFTLIEIIVALFIFAIVGILAAISLQSMIRAHRELNKSDQQLSQEQIAFTLLRRDISQMINRPIRNEDGAKEPAFIASGVDEIDFTKTGLSNPLDAARQSDMQRVGYTFSGSDLVRLTWDVLDQPPKANPASQVLLSGIKTASWQFIADDGNTSSIWPPAVGSNMKIENPSPLPKVVLLVIHFNNGTVIQGVFPVPARGVHAIS